jgi:hypothetical protein
MVPVSDFGGMGLAYCLLSQQKAAATWDFWRHIKKQESTKKANQLKGWDAKPPAYYSKG